MNGAFDDPEIAFAGRRIAKWGEKRKKSPKFRISNGRGSVQDQRFVHSGTLRQLYSTASYDILQSLNGMASVR